jgi:hypothetical protein
MYQEFVILIDRAGIGDCNIMFDGALYQFKPGQTERPVPVALVDWLFRVDQQRVHTTDGEYVQRFGLKDPSEELVARLGGTPDSWPITIDNTRVEGWDTDTYAQREGKVKVLQLKRNPADYANVATPGGFGSER